MIHFHHHAELQYVAVASYYFLPVLLIKQREPRPIYFHPNKPHSRPLAVSPLCGVSKEQSFRFGSVQIIPLPSLHPTIIVPARQKKQGFQYTISTACLAGAGLPPPPPPSHLKKTNPFYINKTYYFYCVKRGGTTAPPPPPQSVSGKGFPHNSAQIMMQVIDPPIHDLDHPRKIYLPGLTGPGQLLPGLGAE